MFHTPHKSYLLFSSALIRIKTHNKKSSISGLGEFLHHLPPSLGCLILWCVCAPTSNFFIITKQCDKLHHIYLIVSVSDFNLIPPSFSQISLKHKWPDLELKERTNTSKGISCAASTCQQMQINNLKKNKNINLWLWYHCFWDVVSHLEEPGLKVGPSSCHSQSHHLTSPEKLEMSGPGNDSTLLM